MVGKRKLKWYKIPMNFLYTIIKGIQGDCGGKAKMEKQYIITLRVTVDEEELEANGGDIQEMIYDSMMETPLSFNIEDCREISD